MTNDSSPGTLARHDAIEKRLDALDTQNRRLKQALVAVVAIAAAVSVRAQVASGAVTGDRFVLVDAQNRTRATLELAPSPGSAGGRFPVMTFVDAGGKLRMRVGLGPRGPVLEVVDENGKTKDYLAPPGVRPLT